MFFSELNVQFLNIFVIVLILAVNSLQIEGNIDLLTYNKERSLLKYHVATCSSLSVQKFFKDWMLCVRRLEVFGLLNKFLRNISFFFSCSTSSFHSYTNQKCELFFWLALRLDSCEIFFQQKIWCVVKSEMSHPK